MKTIRYSILKVIATKILELIFVPLTLFSRKQSTSGKQKILLFDPFELGDAVMLSAMIDPLSKKFPDAEIHLLIKKMWGVIFTKDPRIQKIHGFTMPWAERKNKWSAFVKNILPLWALILELRKEKFSIVIDARGDIRAQAFLVLTGCPVRVGCTQYVNSNISFRGLLLTNKAGYVPSLSKVQYNLHVLKEGLGCNVEGAKLRLIYEKPGSVKNEFRIVCHPGAGWKYRLWPEERWSDLVNRILLRYSVHITFVGGPGEETLLNSIKKISNEKVSFKVTTLEQLLETISSSDLFIGLDSGPMHIATALDKSIIALFGPGNLTIWRPESEKAKVITHADKFECAPCVQNSCIHPDNPCMKAITTDEVFEVVESVLTVKLQK